MLFVLVVCVFFICFICLFFVINVNENIILNIWLIYIVGEKILNIQKEYIKYINKNKNGGLYNVNRFIKYRNINVIRIKIIMYVSYVIIL